MSKNLSAICVCSLGADIYGSRKCSHSFSLPVYQMLGWKKKGEVLLIWFWVLGYEIDLCSCSSCLA